MSGRMTPAGRCCVCGCPITLPEELYLAATKSTAINFYCAYGHAQHFSTITKEKFVEDDTEEVAVDVDGEDNVVPIR